MAFLFTLILPTSVLAADMGLKGWGPRLGVADDPDQIIGGVHWNLEELARQLLGTGIDEA